MTARSSLLLSVCVPIKWVLFLGNGDGTMCGRRSVTLKLGAGSFSSFRYRESSSPPPDLHFKCLTCAHRIPSGGISSFGNLILESFGYTNFQSILFNLPLGVIQIIAILGGGWLATRFRTKGMVIVSFATLASIGTILMLVVPRSNKGVLLFGYYLVRFIITHCLFIKVPLLTLTRSQPWLLSHL